MRTEIIIGGLALLAILSKLFFHIPFGAVLIVLSLSTLCFIYFPLFFYFFSNKGIKNQNYLVSGVAGFGFAMCVIGILFKIMYWPTGDQMLKSALLFSVPGIVLVFYNYFKTSKSTSEYEDQSASQVLDESFVIQKGKISETKAGYYKQMLIRSIVIPIIALTFYVIPSSGFISVQYGYDPEIVRLKVLMVENPNNPEYMEQLRKYMLEKYGERW